MLYMLLALVSAAVAAFMFITIRSQEVASTLYLIIGGLCVLLTIVFGVLFLTTRVNQTEDIHVTE